MRKKAASLGDQNSQRLHGTLELGELQLLGKVHPKEWWQCDEVVMNTGFETRPTVVQIVALLLIS